MKYFSILLLILFQFCIAGCKPVSVEKNETRKAEKMDSDIIELRINETKTASGLSIKNNGGGHEIATDGDDLLFTVLTLNTTELSENVSVSFPGGEREQILWNGYLLTIIEIGWDGDFVKIGVEKAGDPRISKEQALDLTRAYIKNLKDVDTTLMGFNDKGSYYAVSVYPESKDGKIINLRIDKFTGEISEK